MVNSILARNKKPAPLPELPEEVIKWREKIKPQFDLIEEEYYKVLEGFKDEKTRRHYEKKCYYYVEIVY